MYIIGFEMYYMYKCVDTANLNMLWLCLQRRKFIFIDGIGNELSLHIIE